MDLKTITTEDLKQKLATFTNPVSRAAIEQELQKRDLAPKAASGDELPQILMAIYGVIDKMSQSGGAGMPSTTTGGAPIDSTQVEQIVKDALKKNKIKLDDLEPSLQSYLTAQAKVSLKLLVDDLPPAAYKTQVGGQVSLATLQSPLFQKICTDAVAMNNIYLYGTAGSGKTYIATQVAEFFGYQYIEINCNQYTSPLEIIGGQTIDGYQEGKLIRAWGNLKPDGKGVDDRYKGAVLCIDELPKIDPNTAGLFNAALARVKEEKIKGGVKIMPTIENGRGQAIEKGRLIIIATGNLRLNELSTEYEANFKQDLSLQDRFAGSTYRIDYDYKSEWDTILKDFAFIFIPMMKLREKIIEQRYTGQAFVSRRILQNMKDTYKIYRDIKDGIGTGSKTIDDAIKKPKTLKDSVDAFLSLFKGDAVTILKTAMNYDGFMRAIQEKENMPINALNTKAEIDEATRIIEAHEQRVRLAN